MKMSVRAAVESGMPSLAECGGFMYLHETIEGKTGTPYPMVGVIKGAAETPERSRGSAIHRSRNAKKSARMIFTCSWSV